MENLSKWAHFEQKRFEYLDANLRNLKKIETGVNKELKRIKSMIYTQKSK